MGVREPKKQMELIKLGFLSERFKELQHSGCFLLMTLCGQTLK